MGTCVFWSSQPFWLRPFCEFGVAPHHCQSKQDSAHFFSWPFWPKSDNENTTKTGSCDGHQIYGKYERRQWHPDEQRNYDENGCIRLRTHDENFRAVNFPRKFKNRKSGHTMDPKYTDHMSGTRGTQTNKKLPRKTCTHVYEIMTRTSS